MKLFQIRNNLKWSTAKHKVHASNSKSILPVLTSRTNRTALLTPWTSACVHAARSREVCTRNTWASTPCRVPDLVPNVRISPVALIDGCFPEWTSLQLQTNCHEHKVWVKSSSAVFNSLLDMIRLTLLAKSKLQTDLDSKLVLCSKPGFKY